MTDGEAEAPLLPESTFSLGSTSSSSIMARSAALRTCRIVCHLFTMIVMKFWKLCTSACLIILLMFWFWGGAITTLFLMFSVFGIFYYAQDMFLYYPEQPPGARVFVEQPARYQLPSENVFVKTPDGVTLNMYFIKHSQSQSYPTILLLHGNAGNIGQRLMIAVYLYNLCRCNVLLLEYRGYGKSTGRPSESGLYTDAETGVLWLRDRADVDSKKIFIFGSSLGGAVAIKVASNPKFQAMLAGVILENTFTSLPEMAKSLLKMKALDFLPYICFKNKYPSEHRIGKITVPTLFLSGQADELIPPAMMSDMYNMSGSTQKRLVPLEGGTHNETCLCAGFYEAIAEFVHTVSSGTNINDNDDSMVQMDPDTTVL